MTGWIAYYMRVCLYAKEQIYQEIQLALTAVVTRNRQDFTAKPTAQSGTVTILLPDTNDKEPPASRVQQNNSRVV